MRRFVDAAQCQPTTYSGPPSDHIPAREYDRERLDSAQSPTFHTADLRPAQLPLQLGEPTHRFETHESSAVAPIGSAPNARLSLPNSHQSDFNVLAVDTIMNDKHEPDSSPLPNQPADDPLSADDSATAAGDQHDLELPSLDDESAALDEIFEAEADGGERSLEAMQAELDETQAKWLRAEAELDNFRKRSRREQQEQAKYASTPLMVELLGVIDNLDRAIQSAAENEQQGGLLEGVKMVATQLETTLQQHGCQAVTTVGEVFDPNRHEAVIMEPSDDQPPQTILRELRKGYQLHDRVIRPPQVVVAAPSNNG